MSSPKEGERKIKDIPNDEEVISTESLQYVVKRKGDWVIKIPKPGFSFQPLLDIEVIKKLGDIVPETHLEKIDDTYVLVQRYTEGRPATKEETERIADEIRKRGVIPRGLLPKDIIVDKTGRMWVVDVGNFEIQQTYKPSEDTLPAKMPNPNLKDVIIEVLKQEGKPVPLFALIDALKSEGYSQEDVEQSLSELEDKGYVKKGRTRTLFGEEETVELIREPEEVAKLTEFVEEEKVELTPSEQRTLEALKRVFGVEEPEITEVDGTKTVIVEYRGEKINIAIGEVKKPELFEPLSLEGKIWYVKKSPALERLKRKLKGVEEKEIRRPTAGVTEYGALRRYEQAKEAIEFLKAMQKMG